MTEIYTHPLTGNRYYCVDIDEDTLPSQVPNYLRCVWISFDTINRKMKEKLEDKTGKWMIFSDNHPEYLDELWPVLKEATIRKLLGIGVKCATPYQKQQGAPLCVYTKNFEDHDDVLRVLCGLRDAGVDQRVAYKSDEMTLSGMKGSLWYSPAHTRLMQRPKAYQGRPPYRYG